MKNMLDRRQFVKGVAAAGSAAILVSCGQTPSRWLFLTEAEGELVQLVTEQIIPQDQDSGAREAGVVYFIDKQLAGAYARYQHDYRYGLAGVEETCREMFLKRFAELKWEQQTSVLEALASGQAKGKTWELISCSYFFELIRDHTMQGFYGSPRHGGNRGYVSFRMLKIDYPQLIGQNRYA